MSDRPITSLPFRLLTSCLLLPCLALSATMVTAQDLDPSGGTYKPRVLPRHKMPRLPTRPAVPRPKPKPGEPLPPESHEPSPPEPHEPLAEAARHYDLGNAAYDRDDLEKAVTEYEAALKTDPKFVDALIELGSVNYDLSDLDAAVDAWERALFLDKTIPELHNNLANARYVRRDFEKAVVEYMEAIRLRPTYYDALFGLGNTYMALKRFDDAIPYFQRAIDARGTPFPDARSNMAWAMLHAGKLKEAEVTARQAIDEIGATSPESVKSWYALASILNERRDYPGATSALESAIKVCTGCPEEQVARLYYSLGLILEVKGDHSGAADAFDQYLRLAPYVTNGADVRKRIARLRAS